MSQACYFTPAESKNNPLYQKMRERFSCGGSMTIGELMLRRADRAAAKEAPSATITAPVAKKAKKANTHIERHHATAISCVFLAFIAVTLIVLLLSSYTGLSITASPADTNSVVSGDGNVVSDAVDGTNESSSFDNILGAMYQSFGE